MDQNYQAYQQPYQNYTQPPREKNAAYYRERAREALKNKWVMAVVAALLVSLLGGALMLGGASFSFSLPGGENVSSGTAPDMMPALPSVSALFNGIILAVIGVTAVVSVAVTLIVGSPVTVGYQKFNLDLIDGKEAKIGTLFTPFRTCFGKSILLRVLYSLIEFATLLPMIGGMGVFFVMNSALLLSLSQGFEQFALPDEAYIGILLLSLLIFLLCCIVSIVLSVLVTYRYAFCFTILAEYPEMSATDALRNSAGLMKGKIWKLFCLQFSFIGWGLLLALATCCTCGIGSLGGFVLAAYQNAATTAFYDDIANRVAAKETEFPSIDPSDYVFEDATNEATETAPEASEAPQEEQNPDTETP